MGFQLAMGDVAVSFHRSFLDGSVHALDLSIGPGMIDFRQSMFDTILTADAIKNRHEGVFIAGAVGELDTVVGQDSMDSVRDGFKQVA